MSDDLDFDMEVVKSNQTELRSDSTSVDEGEGYAAERTGAEASQSAGVDLVDLSPGTDWERRSLQQLCEIQGGLSWDKDQEVDQKEGDIPVLKIGNVQDGYFDLDDTTYLKGVDDSEIEKYKARKGWIVMIGSNGSGERVGHCGIIDRDMEFVYASFLHGLGVDSNQIAPRLLYYFLNKEDVQRKLTSFTAGSTSLKNLNKSLVEKLRVPLPPLPEQRKIASVLYVVDQAIQKTEEIIEQAEQLHEGTRRELLRDGFYRHSGNQNTATGTYPDRWEIVRGDAIFSLKSGDFLESSERTKSGKYPVYGGNGIMGFTNQSTVPQDTVVIGRVGAYCGNVHITISDSWVTDNAILIDHLSDDMDPGFLMHVLESVGLNRFAEQSAQPRISQSTLRNLKIPVPPSEEQTEIVETLSSIEESIQKNKESIDRLKCVKKGLMQDLLTGEVRTAGKAIEVLDEVAAHG